MMQKGREEKSAHLVPFPTLIHNLWTTSTLAGRVFQWKCFNVQMEVSCECLSPVQVENGGWNPTQPLNCQKECLLPHVMATPPSPQSSLLRTQ